MGMKKLILGPACSSARLSPSLFSPNGDPFESDLKGWLHMTYRLGILILKSSPGLVLQVTS